MRRGRLSGVMAIAAASVTVLSGCVPFGSGGAPAARCVSTPVSPSVLEKYSLPELPRSDDVRFCEAPDKDGSSAQLSFRSGPEDADSYLKSLDLDPATFTDLPPDTLAELAREDGDGWSLTRGEAYRRGTKARDWNGQCLVDYTAYVRKGADRDGRVYLAMYCQS